MSPYMEVRGKVSALSWTTGDWISRLIRSVKKFNQFAIINQFYCSTVLTFSESLSIQTGNSQKDLFVLWYINLFFVYSEILFKIYGMLKLMIPTVTSVQVSTYTVSSLGSLGKVLLLKVEKESVFPPFDDEWYCSKIVVTLPEGLAILFPCYRWISTGEQVELRGGKGQPQIPKPVKFDRQHFLQLLLSIFPSCQSFWGSSSPAGKAPRRAAES